MEVNMGGRGLDGSSRQEALLKELVKEKDILESIGSCPRSLKLLKGGELAVSEDVFF